MKNKPPRRNDRRKARDAKRLQPGDHVRHWFAGDGVVSRIASGNTVYCDWDTGDYGGADPKDLEVLTDG